MFVRPKPAATHNWTVGQETSSRPIADGAAGREIQVCLRPWKCEDSWRPGRRDLLPPAHTPRHVTSSVTTRRLAIEIGPAAHAPSVPFETNLGERPTTV